MSATTSCPDSAQLLRLLDGELPQAEQAALTRHLDGCARCQRAVEELASGGRSWSETATHLSAEQPGGEYEPALCRAVKELAGGGPDPTRADPTTADAPVAGDDGLSFLAPSDKPGRLGRLDHYEVLEVVGRGGMGVVLRAFDEKLHRVVAIKALAPQLATSSTARKRFVREAQAAAAVAHDHVVAIHAVQDAGPVPYLVMQFVAGQSLEDLIRRGGPLDVKEVLRIGMQAASGLAAAHAQGLVHRDVKPANILLENGVQRVKLTDFGLARAVGDASLTQVGVIAGTPQFMSPEQARGEAVDARSDLFSLGSVLYTLCTGRPPFRASNTMAVLRRVCEDAPRPVREVNPDAPDWLAAAVMKLLAKDPAQRFRTAAEVAELLGQYLAHVQQPLLVARPPAVVVTEPAPGGHEQLAPRGLRAVLLAMARYGAVVGLPIAVLGLVLAVWFGVQLLREGGPRINSPNVPPPAGGDDPEGLAKPASPLDGRRREDIAPELLALAGRGDPARAPQELVAVLRDGAAGRASSVAVSPDGRLLASGGVDKAVRLWDLAAWKAGDALPPVRTLARHTDQVYSLAFGPDGRTLASGSFDTTIILWDVATGAERRTLTGHTREQSHLAFSPDGQTLAAGTDDGAVKLWDVRTGQERAPLRWHKGIVRAVAFSPDGQWLASAGQEHIVQLCEAATGRRVRTFRGSTAFTSLAFSPDSRRLFAACDGTSAPLRFWDLDTGKETAFGNEHAHTLGLAVHPGGRLVATGNRHGVVQLWDVETGRAHELATRVDRNSVNWVDQVAFTPEGRYLATANGNGTVNLFRLAGPGELPQLPPDPEK
jgi:WD40 repeat protein